MQKNQTHDHYHIKTPLRFCLRNMRNICGALFLLTCLISTYAQADDSDQKVKDNYVRALQEATGELSAVGMQVVQIIGSFFDIKTKLKTQQYYQTRLAEAHKDYHPSEEMCAFGSFIKSVARTEEKGSFDKQALNAQMMALYTNQTNAISAQGPRTDTPARLEQFRTTYCNPADQNAGLYDMCDHNQGKLKSGDKMGPQGEERVRMNKDIDYQRTLANPLTLDINFSDQALTYDEEDVHSLARHLYWPKTFNYIKPEDASIGEHKYAKLRSLLARSNVAHSSFSNIVGMKASAAPGGAGKESGWNYMKAMLKDFELQEKEIHAYLGDFPSYHAQMEVLSKKIYQRPEFYTNLYDKPANVARMGVSMEAIKLMQGRDHLKSALRREMSTSLLVENALRKHAIVIEGVLARQASE